MVISMKKAIDATHKELLFLKNLFGLRVYELSVVLVCNNKDIIDMLNSEIHVDVKHRYNILTELSNYIKDKRIRWMGRAHTMTNTSDGKLFDCLQEDFIDIKKAMKIIDLVSSKTRKPIATPDFNYVFPN